jgi:hypothetical protein
MDRSGGRNFRIAGRRIVALEGAAPKRAGPTIRKLPAGGGCQDWRKIRKIPNLCSQGFAAAAAGPSPNQTCSRCELSSRQRAQPLLACSCWSDQTWRYRRFREASPPATACQATVGRACIHEQLSEVGILEAASSLEQCGRGCHGKALAVKCIGDAAVPPVNVIWVRQRRRER